MVNSSGDSLTNGTNFNLDSENARVKESSIEPAKAQSSNGHAGANGVANSAVKDKKQPEVIEIDDDEDAVIVEPPPKRRKENASPVPDDPQVSKPPQPSTSSSTSEESVKLLTTEKKEPELTPYYALLDRLEEYVRNAIDSKENVDRKVLDALLAAINVQVQKDPYSVRKLILEKQLVLPNTISFPPSQVVELLIEHDPDHQLSRVITKLYGEERLKLSENERRERQQLKIANPAPNMTKLLMEIGQDLVQETTYSDIVHARNLPEIPKNMETYKQVAAQLKPVWEGLKTKNEPFKLKVNVCQVCGFKTDSRTVLAIHRQTPHYAGRKYQCAMCPEFDTNESRINRHYIQEHGLQPLEREDPPAKVQCPVCEEDFPFKGHRDAHLKLCKRDVNRIKTLQATRAPEHIGMINRWLWDKPPIEPSILAQQQDLQKQQQIKQQRLAAATSTSHSSTPSQSSSAFAQRLSGGASNGATRNLTPQQLLAQQKLQQQLLMQANKQQLAQLLRGQTSISPAILQAMQQLQKQQQLIQSRLPVTGGAQSVTKPATPRGRAAALPQQMANVARNMPLLSNANASGALVGGICCEICDSQIADREQYLIHLQQTHKQLRGKCPADMHQGAPLACSRCRDRFWTYEGLERHLVMAHGLVTSDLLAKAQRKEDGGRCKKCGKQYAFNMLQHLVTDHQTKLCSAEIMYSCDVCSFKCSSYQKLEAHLSDVHPKTQTSTPAGTTVR